MGEKAMEGDGNSQFRAVADQCHGHQSKYAVVKDKVLQQLRSNPEHYNSPTQIRDIECSTMGGFPHAESEQDHGNDILNSGSSAPHKNDKKSKRRRAKKSRKSRLDPDPSQ